MRKILTISLLVCLYNMALGQAADSNAIFLKSKGKWECPVARGKILRYEKSSEVPPAPGISFISDSSHFVHAVFDGEVIIVTPYDDVFMIVTKYGNYFIGYSNLAKSLVKKGDKIKIGQSIGNMGLNLDAKYVLDMQLVNPPKEIDINLWFKKSPANFLQ